MQIQMKSMQGMKSMLSPFRNFPRLNSGIQMILAKFLTSSEASAALRPFIFNVHPDLFSNFPEARSVNENSLKQLNGYLHELPESRLRDPLSLTFYVRPDRSKNEKNSGPNLKTITIRLSNDAYGTVKHILETCQLDTSHLTKSAVQFSQPWKRLYDVYQKQSKNHFQAFFQIFFIFAVFAPKLTDR